MKGRFHIPWLVAFLGLAFIFIPPSLAKTVEEMLVELNKLPAAERQKQLEAGAKKEAVLKFASNENVELITLYHNAFAARYPFLKVESSRASGAKGVEKIVMESRAGKLDTDVVAVPFETVGYVKKQGVWARYLSPELKHYADQFKDREGYWATNHYNIAVIGYNTKLVKSSEAPRDYPDLLNPKWKGDLSIDVEPDRAVQGWLIAWGEERTREYMKALMRNGATVRRGHTLQIQLLCSGEIGVAVEVYAYRVAQLTHEKNCPSGMSFPNPTPGAPGSEIGVTRNAPHPHAAALYVDFVLGVEGSSILAGTGRIPARRGVKALYEEVSNLEEKGVNILMIPVEQAERLDPIAKKLVEEILIRRQF